MISKGLIDTIKKIVKNINNKFGNNYKEQILSSCVKITEETGELSSEVLKNLGIARTDKLNKSLHDDLKEEFADSILSILVLAEQMGIDINDAIEAKLTKIENRGGF